MFESVGLRRLWITARLVANQQPNSPRPSLVAVLTPGSGCPQNSSSTLLLHSGPEATRLQTRRLQRVTGPSCLDPPSPKTTVVPKNYFLSFRQPPFSKASPIRHCRIPQNKQSQSSPRLLSGVLPLVICICLKHHTSILSSR
jgi:hypothetical protein